MKTYPIAPVPKPRMTRADRWKKRACVLRYWAFRDEIKARGVVLPERPHVTFVVPMPASWSGKKKGEMVWTPHTQKPDVDNYLKGLLDAVFEDDAGVWDVRATKIWGNEGMIHIVEMPPETVV